MLRTKPQSCWPNAVLGSKPLIWPRELASLTSATKPWSNWRSNIHPAILLEHGTRIAQDHARHFCHDALDGRARRRARRFAAGGCGLGRIVPHLLVSALCVCPAAGKI